GGAAVAAGAAPSPAATGCAAPGARWRGALRARAVVFRVRRAGLFL
ncbi:MAG: hypothetical protein RL071_5114, partial [Pseudomonadota bacterium]